MNHLKLLVRVVALTIILSPSALAGEMPTVPCAPGEQCPIVQPTPEDRATEQTSTSADSNATVLLTETAVDLLESILSIY